MVQLALVTQCHRPRHIHLVVADPIAGRFDARADGPRLLAGVVDLEWDAPSNAAVGSLSVVVLGEAVELTLEQLLGRGRFLLGHELLERLVEALYLALGLGRPCRAWCRCPG